jgi:hypothetical protein
MKPFARFARRNRPARARYSIWSPQRFEELGDSTTNKEAACCAICSWLRSPALLRCRLWQRPQRWRPIAASVTRSCSGNVATPHGAATAPTGCGVGLHEWSVISARVVAKHLFVDTGSDICVMAAWGLAQAIPAKPQAANLFFLPAYIASPPPGALALCHLTR